MFLGTGALSTRPLSDPDSVLAYVPPPLPDQQLLNLCALVLKPLPGLTVLPTDMYSANLAGTAGAEATAAEPGIVGIEPPEDCALTRSTLGVIVIVPEDT